MGRAGVQAPGHIATLTPALSRVAGEGVSSKAAG
jgi:hypothetical protein